ncbi:MAG: hypothetical protein ACM3YO_07595, partial [Bacteroidota bacterium]
MASIDRGIQNTSLTPVSPAPQKTATPLTDKGALEKVGEGWVETVQELPRAAKDLLVKTGNAILHPIDFVQGKIEEIKNDPVSFFKKLALQAGTIGLAFISPPLGAMVGAAMTASMVVIPTVRFATAKTEEEIKATAHGAADQLVSYAANRAVGYGMKKAVDAIKAHGQEQIGEIHARQAKGVVHQRGVNPENVARLRQTAEQVKADVRNQYAAALKQKQPGITEADLEAILNQKDVRKMILNETFGIMNAYALKSSGVDLNLATQLELPELRSTRRYMGRIDNDYDLSDAAKAINQGLKKGVRDAASLTLGSEEALALTRGLGKDDFASFTKAGLDSKDIQDVRSFSDRLATSQGGKYLQYASRQADRLKEVPALKHAVAGEILKDIGFKGTENLNTPTRVGLIQDLGMEEVNSAELYVQTANKLLKEGNTDYYAIHRAFEENMLAKMGVPQATLKKLADGWQQDMQDNPSQAVGAYKELRDFLRVLPQDVRGQAISIMNEGLSQGEFGLKLKGLLDGKIQASIGDKDLARSIIGSLKDDSEKANLVSTLSRLPEDVKKQVFTGLDPKADLSAQVVDRFQNLIEDRFQVKVNRTVGLVAGQADGTVIDWDPHGVIQLYNGLEKVSVGGKLPDALKGTTYFRTSGDYGTYGYQFAMGGKDFVTITDFSLQAHNTDEAMGLTSGEGTIVHESGHA